MRSAARRDETANYRLDMAITAGDGRDGNGGSSAAGLAAPWLVRPCRGTSFGFRPLSLRR